MGPSWVEIASFHVGQNTQCTDCSGQDFTICWCWRIDWQPETSLADISIAFDHIELFYQWRSSFMGCIITQLRVSHSWLPKSTTYSSYGGLYPDVYILICTQAFDSALLKLLFSLDNDSLEKRWGRCRKWQICEINNHVFAICSGGQFSNGFNLLEDNYGLINFVSSKTHAKTQAPLETLQGAGSSRLIPIKRQ